MTDNILLTVKQYIGGFGADYTAFDTDLTILINSELSTLFQVGLGDNPFKIVDGTETWEDLLGCSVTDIESVKELICIRVKMMFDPPSNSFVLDALKEKAAELTWRINVATDLM